MFSHKLSQACTMAYFFGATVTIFFPFQNVRELVSILINSPDFKNDLKETLVFYKRPIIFRQINLELKFGYRLKGINNNENKVGFLEYFE